MYMKIMYLLFSFTVGGTERLVANICNQMKANGEEVFLLIVNDLTDDKLLNTLDSKINVKLLKRKVGSKDKISPLVQVAKYINENKIDVVHCNSFNAPELLVLSKIINPRCKIVSTIHGVGQFKKTGKFRIALKNWICDQFIGISDVVKNDIVQAGIKEGKVRRIYNGIDVKKYECAQKKLFDADHIVIGCIARIMPSLKGQDILLRAAYKLKKQFPHIKVIFAGGVAEEQKNEYKELQEYVKNNDLSANVTFLGSVDDIPAFLNTIDICVVPSRSEGFGLALVEALSMGVPCVASNIEGPKEIIDNEGIGMMFESENSDELANVIVEIINDFQKVKDTVWKRRTDIKNKYSIQTMCEKLLQAYSH